MLPKIPYNWNSDTVVGILGKQEYIGNMVNFKTTTKSFKNKKIIERPKEEWQIFEGTHPAIINAEEFWIVQEIRSHKRRPTKTGYKSIFSGVLYCGDCGERMYYLSTNNYKREQAAFTCSAYHKASSNCSAHFIREKVVYQLVLENLQKILFSINYMEKIFVQKQLDAFEEDK